ncbi:MAG: hypothetical protein JNM65_09765 [Verrucomicrobiaceae bacterium]|nr:hypothetical protein [Verrucomicrobiaceae bacterium]
MNYLSPAQEQARRFNEDEAVQHEFRRLRMLRRLAIPQPALPEDVADGLDWQQALITCRQTRAISLPLP